MYEVPLLGSPRTITMDGHVAWVRERPVRGGQAVRNGDFVRFNHVRGTHTFAWESCERGCHGREHDHGHKGRHSDGPTQPTATARGRS